MQQLEPLGIERGGKQRDAGQVAVGPVEVSDQADADGVGTCTEDDRDRRGGGLCGKSDGISTHGDDQVGLGRHKFDGKGRDLVETAVGPTDVEGNVLPVDKPGRFEALAKGFQQVRIRREGPPAQIGNARTGRPRLCPARQGRYRQRRGGEKAPPLHSMISPACTSRVGGRLIPSADAVFRLTASSSTVGCSIGSVAGTAPSSTRMT